MKYLKLGLHEGKLFLSNKPNNDRSVETALTGGKINNENKDFIHQRKSMSRFVEPLTFYQIRNLIHALFMERPVPSKRYVPYESIDHYNEMALNSYLIVTTPIIIDDKGREWYPKEEMSVKKMCHNAWKKSVNIDWEMVKKLLRSKKRVSFEEFVGLLKERGVDVDKPYEDVIKDVRALDHDVNREIVEWLKGENEDGKKRNCGSIAYSLDRTNSDLEKWKGYIYQNTTGSGLTVVNAIEKVTKINGVLFVPVQDEDIEKLRRSKGTATYLDGGIVTIDGIVHSEEIEWENYDEEPVHVGEKLTEPEEVFD